MLVILVFVFWIWFGWRILLGRRLLLALRLWWRHRSIPGVGMRRIVGAPFLVAVVRLRRRRSWRVACVGVRRVVGFRFLVAVVRLRLIVSVVGRVVRLGLTVVAARVSAALITIVLIAVVLVAGTLIDTLVPTLATRASTVFVLIAAARIGLHALTHGTGHGDVLRMPSVLSGVGISVAHGGGLVRSLE